MLIDLLRTHLRPYRHWLAGAVALQMAGTLAALYLPSLNADIIDNGIARGNTGYIVSTGGWMLLVTLIQGASIVGGVYCGARAAMSFGRDVRAAIFGRVGSFVIENRHVTTEQAEERVERQAREFELLKPYLVDRWRGAEPGRGPDPARTPRARRLRRA